MPISFNCDNCGKEVINRNITHFGRVKKHYCSNACRHEGNKSKLSLQDRFEQYIFYSPDGCHYWIGADGTGGYGAFAFKSRDFRRAHRVSYTIYRGDIPDDKLVCHSCDNRKCVNPHHLFIGDQKDNVLDAHKKGRARVICRGEGHIDAKLNEQKVIDIRKRIANGERKADLAREFFVKQTTIHALVTRKSWKHV